MSSDAYMRQEARPGPCITNVFATCRKNFSQWHRSFQRKLRSHWLKFLRHVAITLVIQGPGLCWLVACFGAKPLFEAMLAYFSSGPSETNFKFWLKFKHFRQRKRLRKCYLQNDAIFPQWAILPYFYVATIIFMVHITWGPYHIKPILHMKPISYDTLHDSTGTCRFRYAYQWFNSLWLSDAIWLHRSRSSLAQIRVVTWRHQAIIWTNVD